MLNDVPPLLRDIFKAMDGGPIIVAQNLKKYLAYLKGREFYPAFLFMKKPFIWKSDFTMLK